MGGSFYPGLGGAMKKIQNVLLFYNKEFGRITETVYQIVSKNHARLKILDVFDNFEQYLELLPPSSSVDELKAVVTAERRHEILRHTDKYSDISDRISVSLRFGNPVVETIREAVRGDYDLVIKAASGKKTFKERLFGDVALKLLRKCPTPVLIVNPSKSGTFGNILAPVDPERPDTPVEESGQPVRFSQKILETALLMAHLQNSRLHILHCWSLPGETLLSSGRGRMDAQKLQQMLGLAQNIHTQRLDSLVKGLDFSGIGYSVTVIKGDAGKTIVDYADQNKIDLIVMGSIGSSFSSGLLFGSTAEKVINRTSCSVLSIKPPEFKSPVIV